MAINPEMVTSVLVSATLDAALKVVALFRGLTSSTHAFGDFAPGQQNQLPRHSSSAAGVTGAPVSVSEKLPPTKKAGEHFGPPAAQYRLAGLSEQFELSFTNKTEEEQT
jgi:hypothetical protein